MPRPRLKKVVATLANLDGKSTPEAQSKAGSLLGRRTRKKYGLAYMRELASHGAAAFWGKMTPEERALELRRRALIRKRNYQAKVAAAIASYRER